MRAVLCGPPRTGKTTLFDGLCGFVSAHPADAKTHRLLSISLKDDPRLVRLRSLTGRPKSVPARFTLCDPSPAASEGQRTALMREADSLVCVVDAFTDRDPQQQKQQFLQNLRDEDLCVLEGRLMRVEAKLKKGGAASEEDEKERSVLLEAIDRLRGGGDLKELFMESSNRKLLAHFGLLSAKSVVFVANTSEENPRGSPEWAYPISAKLESELVFLEAEERAEFMEAYGLEELGWEGLVRAIYFGGGWGMFYTIGEKEVRAWEMAEGTTAYEAAEMIHTDFAKHFVKAEIVRYEDFVSCGGWDRAVAAGKMLRVGPDHLLRDGDVLYIKAAVR